MDWAPLGAALPARGPNGRDDVGIACRFACAGLVAGGASSGVAGRLLGPWGRRACAVSEVVVVPRVRGGQSPRPRPGGARGGGGAPGGPGPQPRGCPGRRGRAAPRPGPPPGAPAPWPYPRPAVRAAGSLVRSAASKRARAVAEVADGALDAPREPSAALGCFPGYSPGWPGMRGGPSSEPLLPYSLLLCRSAGLEAASPRGPWAFGRGAASPPPGPSPA